MGTVVFMVPLEMLALHLGVSRQTVWSWKLALEAAGLVASDVLYQQVGGKQRAIGTLWAVRLRPGKARLERDDYLHPWRNLALDMGNGVLSYAWVKAHKENGIRPTLDAWSSGPRGKELSRTPNRLPWTWASSWCFPRWRRPSGPC